MCAAMHAHTSDTMALPMLLSKIMSTEPPPALLPPSSSSSAAAAAATTSSKRKKKLDAAPPHLFGVGNRAFAMGDLAAAEAAMLELLSYDEACADAHALLVFVYEENKDALKTFLHDKRRLELTPTEDVTCERLAACARRAQLAGKLVEAIAICNQGLALDATNKQAGLLMCDLLIAAKEFPRAIETCRRVLEAGYDPHVLLVEARARVEMGDLQNALRILVQVAQAVLAPATDAASSKPARGAEARQRLAVDEDAVVATGLSAVSGAVDLLMKAGQWSDARALLVRCDEFLRTGVCADATRSWSWDVVALAGGQRAFRPKPMPLDLAVKRAVCALESGLGAADALGAVGLLRKVGVKVDEVGAVEELHELLAAGLLRHGHVREALGLLQRVDSSVVPLRRSEAHNALFAEALDSAGMREHAAEVRARVQRAAGAAQEMAVALVRGWSVSPSVLHRRDVGDYGERAFAAMGTAEFVRAAAEALGQSLNGGTLRACGARELLGTVEGAFVGLGAERFTAVVAALLRALEAPLPAAEALLAASVDGGACQLCVARIAVETARSPAAMALLVEQAVAKGTVDDDVVAWARSLPADALDALRLRYLDCEWLADVAEPTGVRLVREFNNACVPRTKRLRAGLHAAALVPSDAKGSLMDMLERV